jgi:hypothetical protein
MQDRQQDVAPARGSSPPPPLLSMRRSISYQGVPVSTINSCGRVNRGATGPATKIFSGLLGKKKASSISLSSEKDGHPWLGPALSPSQLQTGSKHSKQAAASNPRCTPRHQRNGSRLPGAASPGPLPASAASPSLPSCSPCLGGSVLVHNMLACVPAASPFVVLRALTAALRRQAVRQRRTWWGSLLLGAMPKWQQQQVRQPALKPAVPLVHFYNFLRGIPLWIRQVVRHDDMVYLQLLTAL